MKFELQNISQLLNADSVQSCFMNTNCSSLFGMMGMLTGSITRYSLRCSNIFGGIKRAKEILGRYVKCYDTKTVGEMILFSGAAITLADMIEDLSSEEKSELKSIGSRIINELLINIPLEADRAFSKENDDITDERSQNYDEMA